MTEANNQAQEFPCKQCGAKQKFEPGMNALKCEYCGYRNHLSNTADQPKEEKDYATYFKELANQKPKEEVKDIKCTSCAATTSCESHIESFECPYCGTHLVNQGSQHELIKPEYLLPFKIKREQGNQKYKTWLQKLWFAPNDLKKYATQAEKLNGLYIPFWTYDTLVDTKYTGQRGEDYYVTENYTTTENGKSVTKTRQVRKTRWYSAYGNVKNDFDDILVAASQSLPKKHLDELEPWDLEKLTKYSPEYLSGFVTESYTIDLAKGFDEAKEKVQGDIDTTIRRHIGGDRQRILSKTSTYNDITFKHILLPVWISAYKYKEKLYRFLVNGRTGEVQGERPWSWIKITLAALTGLAVIGGGIWAYMHFYQ